MRRALAVALATLAAGCGDVRDAPRSAREAPPDAGVVPDGSVNEVPFPACHDPVVLSRADAGTSCTWPLPPLASFDPNRVNFEYEDDSGPRYVLGLSIVAGQSACRVGNPDYYYDDPIAPRAVVFCPSTCQQLNAPTATLKMIFGCPTE